jgi:hypothetical protein
MLKQPPPQGLHDLILRLPGPDRSEKYRGRFAIVFELQRHPRQEVATGIDTAATASMSAARPATSFEPRSIVMLHFFGGIASSLRLTN